MVIIILEPLAPNLVVWDEMASLHIQPSPANNRDQFSHDAKIWPRRISWDNPGANYPMPRHISGNEEKSCLSWLSSPRGIDCLSAATIPASGLDWGPQVVEKKPLSADGNTSWEECEGRNCWEEPIVTVILDEATRGTSVAEEKSAKGRNIVQTSEGKLGCDIINNTDIIPSLQLWSSSITVPR